MLKNNAVELSLYCSQIYSQILQAMTIKQMEDFFKSDAFEMWKKSKEHENKLPNLVLERIDSVTKQINDLGRILARIR